MKKRKKKWALIPALLVLIALLAFGGTSAVMALSSTENTGGFSLAGLLSSYRMFYGTGKITGGNGTAYSGNITDASGAVVDSDASAGYLTAEEESEDYDVKYAVCIYGIGHDTYLDDDGNTQTAGLTFGPASGTDYTSSYKAHLTEQEFLSGESGVCLHWMTWEEIIIQNEIDPTAFEECLENGCTHSVELVLNDTILGESYAGTMDNGDGASVLRYSIAKDYRYWNLSGSGTENANMWSESRMRATLNGADSSTNSTYAGTDTLTTSNCLLTCFPKVLQEAIVAKVVSTNTLAGSSDKSDIEITYDRLWLFSYRELSGYSGTTNLRYEGNQYARMSALNVGTAVTIDYSDTTSISEALLPGYAENGNKYSWWLRTGKMEMAGSYGIYVYVAGSSGMLAAYTMKTYTFYLAPGFCLP